MKAYTTEEIRAMEAAEFARRDSFEIMQQAGAAVARHARAMVGAQGRVLVVVGAGNNGGDALVAATQLHRAGYRDLAVFLAGEPASADAQKALRGWRDVVGVGGDGDGGDGGSVGAVGGEADGEVGCAGSGVGGEVSDDADGGAGSGAGGGAGDALGAFRSQAGDLVIDGLFGIGLNRDIAGDARDWVDAILAKSAPVLAIDVPSGLNVDTGEVMGACVRADATVSFFGAKTGFYRGAGPATCGTIIVDELDREA